ncbi:hypothetical protein V491_00172 [Pseudogymnoascus sp. VKM F-3775]|nr:hypothetical protein V491_00172 [Pseudogymnoascus sp. VKM F-3775]
MTFLGIIDDHHLEQVPGTVILAVDDTEVAEPGATPSPNSAANIKYGTGKASHLVLVPQPSADPNDPLNWSTFKKFNIMAICSFGAILFAAATGPLLNAALAVLVQEFDRSFTDVTQIVSGYYLLVVGASGPFVSAFSRKYGKRPVFLASSLFGLIGAIIGSVNHSYYGLFTARLVSGLSTSAYESVIVALIGDIFFVHQRGLVVSYVQFFLGTITNASSIISGVIATRLSWPYLFYFMAMCSGIQLIALYLFVPETTYHRDARYESDRIALPYLETDDQQKETDEKVTSIQMERTLTTPQDFPPPKTFWQELSIFSGSHSDTGLLQLIIAPFASCMNLAVLWVVLFSGGFAAFNVVTVYVLSQIFSAPPYLLTAEGVGFLSTGPLIGGTLATVLISFINDPFIAWASRKNRSIYEPEYRLVLLFMGFTTGCGLIAFGYLTQQGASLYATSAAHGLLIFGITVVAILTSNYVLDAYRSFSNEVFIASMMFKNFLFFGFSYFVNNWTESAGTRVVFTVWGSLALGLMLTVPVMFYYGKVYRSYWFRNNLFEKFNIMTHAEL